MNNNNTQHLGYGPMPIRPPIKPGMAPMGPPAMARPAALNGAQPMPPHYRPGMAPSGPPSSTASQSPRLVNGALSSSASVPNFRQGPTQPQAVGPPSIRPSLSSSSVRQNGLQLQHPPPPNSGPQNNSVTTAPTAVMPPVSSGPYPSSPGFAPPSMATSGPPMARPSMAPPSMAPQSMARPSMAPPAMAPPSATAPPSMAPPAMAPPPMAPPAMAPPPMAQPSMTPPVMAPPGPTPTMPPLPNPSRPPMPHSGPSSLPPMPTTGPGSSSLNQRYPTAAMPPMPPTPTSSYGNNQPGYGGHSLTSRLGGLSLGQGSDCLDLLQVRQVLPPKQLKPPKPKLQAELWNSYNCSPDIFRCTLTKIPETDSLLKKSRLPLGVMIHPFRDLSHLPVIQCQTIVRCRQCRTYINPFVHFVDQRRWRCNVCYRVNELPEEFLYDPVSKSFGDPSRRPECKSSTIEFIAPSEYMLRPPQPAVYVFLLDVSKQAVESGYVKIFCDTLLEELDKFPGDKRTQISFITYDRTVQFYSMPDGSSQPTQLTVCDIDDMFLPSPSDLLVNLQQCKGLIQQLLEELPHMVSTGNNTESALGAALQAAFKLTSATGGRVSIFQHILPTIGPGALANREAMAEKKNDPALLGPATDFYKKLALDCSGQQIAVDLFAMGSQYIDVATLSGISKFSGGQVQYFPGYHTVHNQPQAAKFENTLRRYFTRKIGLEAVMRIRCTRGLSLHTFHGNFFVRSTDLLSLPNVNPDAGFGMQVSIEDDLRDSREVTFQAALLYTSSKAERRIRVHTLCLPTCASVSEIIHGADQTAIIGMLTKFAADRATNDSIADAKEGLVVSCVDAAETYKNHASMSVPTGLIMPMSLKLMPLYVLACLRTPGFRNNSRTDDRAAAFADFKSLPLYQLIQTVYPDLYRVDDLCDDDEQAIIEESEDSELKVRVAQPSRLQLSFERVSATGMYLMDVGDMLYLYLSRGLHQLILERVLGVTRLHDVDESITELPELENPESEKLRTFVNWLNGNKPYPAPIRVIREDGKMRHLFVERMIEDRFDGSLSYFEFLQRLKQQMKS